ncbi:ATP-binding cassette domain-containing protein [Halopelagius fulvigenes]|uniref:ATP-binding cassette domain-containing protein n=1 Tax=Halopelagius fulvigenes TaxID=1198324 RepID=A0ABD5TWT3_9EURY
MNGSELGEATVGTAKNSEATDAERLAIETVGLRKSFGDVVAVDGVDLRIPRGTVYGLLGPNGAGKTTTIRLLATLLRPDSGTATVLGHDVVTEAAEVRAKVALTGQYASVDEDLTGRENLVLVARLLGLSWRAARSRADELLTTFGLADAADRQVQTYSGGMRRRLDVATSLVVTPEVLFLDEPTTGLDPRSRNQVWDIVRAIAAHGTTVLLTTQYLDEADRLADRLAVIDEGRVIAEGTSRELKAAVGANRLDVRLRDIGQRAEAEAVLTDVLGVELIDGPDRDTLSASVPTEERAAEALTALADAGVRAAEFSLGQASLDEVFLALTGRPAREGSERGDAADAEATEVRP